MPGSFGCRHICCPQCAVQGGYLGAERWMYLRKRELREDFGKDVREKASLYLPSVGKVTILMLLRNLMRLCQYQEMLQKSSTPS